MASFTAYSITLGGTDYPAKYAALLTYLQTTVTAVEDGKFGDGTVSAPGITFASNLSTGIYKVASNTIGFAVGGNNALTLNSNSTTVQGNFYVNGVTSAIGMPSDCWTTAGIQTSPVGGMFYCGGSYRATWSCNGYRDNTSGTNLWVSLGINASTGAAVIEQDPTGTIIFRTESSKLTGAISTVTECARINPDGLGVAAIPAMATNPSYGIALLQSATGATNASNIRVGHTTGTATGAAYATWCYAAAAIGSITQSGTTAVLYNTTSDHRLKFNQAAISGSGSFVDALRPKSWTWADGTHGAGFIAHEFAEVCPAAVVGEKDAVDADGNPIYQAMQASSPEVIAHLIAELQSLRLRVAALEK